MDCELSDSKRCYFIAGGGTGGHVYPGIAIGQALQDLDPGCKVYFVGTAQGLETKLVPAAGFELFLIPGGKLNFQGRYFEKLKTLLKLPFGFFKAARLLLRHPPQAVLGVGGYASGPFVLMASLMGFRTALWEPNAYPGQANRWLSRFVDRAFVVFSEARSKLHAQNIDRLGMPVRAEIESGYEKTKARLASPGAAAPELGRLNVLCFGGSQGSRAVNQALATVLETWGEAMDLNVVHQIGSTDWKIFEERYKERTSWIEAKEFLKDMPDRYAWADLVIARAGASTVAEIAAFGKPAILIPLPGAEAHQEKNAEALAAKNAVIILRQSELTPARLKLEIDSLKSNGARRKQMSENVIEFFEPKAAHQIAKALIDLQTQ
jgi:UDP-N-acetylglucosamine--N-acetylmuramyl-(pentapeptide) pyrophosphoryl-undecaprenol N-acetylglucosamine transferase